MDLQEFKEYIAKQRRYTHDQRNAPKDDREEPRNVGANQQDEPLHRDLQGRRPTTL